MFTCKERKQKYKEVQKVVQKYTNDVYTQFNVKNVLGRGFQGTVYKASHPKTGAIVIKRTTVTESDARRRNLKSRRALRKPVFIEFAAGEMCAQLVLNKICPNVTLTYHHEIIKHCNKVENFGREKYCSLQYMEYINYNTFEEFAQYRHREGLWYNAIFQILAGLYALKLHFNLIHNDFHGRNLLVHKIEPGGYWVYIIDGKRYYVPNMGYIFLVSDFGLSWIPGKMYPGDYVRKRDQVYMLMDSNDTKLNKNTRLTWDLMKLKRLTIDPLLKVSKELPDHFKFEFMEIFRDLIDNSVNVSTLGDIIRELYGSQIIRGKQCKEFPNYCYNKREFVCGERIETYNFNKKVSQVI
ncbi:hypothetical protein EB118_02240 [bacterium]|nr:hypothetical protein [bacterium]NDC93931.1 hypothetical protein [bacterium]NDG28908.1 hypothetical protein [bacterium]